MTSFLPKLKFKYRHTQSNHSQLEKGLLFSLSRHVLSSIIKAHGWSDNDQIIMPGSICEEALKPFLRAGLKIGCYRLDSSLTSDVASIRNNIQPNTVAIIVVHYFGRKDPNIEVIRALCDQLNILLIEDCALCFPEDAHSGIGSYGDYSFFSLWKYLSVPDGSIVYSRGKAKPLNVPLQKADFRRVTKRLISLMLPANLEKYLRLKNHQVFSGQASHNYSEPSGTKESPQAMSFLSRQMLRLVDFESVGNVRRDNYRYIARQLQNHPSLRILWSQFYENSVPYCLPLVTKRPMHLQQFLLQSGIQSELSINDYFPWAGKIEGDKQEMKSISELAGSVLCIPVHQALSEKELIKISSCLIDYE